jgi:hypothetical protein
VICRCAADGPFHIIATLPPSGNVNVTLPVGTFCSVNRPEPSVAALMDVPATDTTIAEPAARTDALPTPDITVPAIVAPETAPLVEGEAVNRDGAAGELTSFFPQALAISPMPSAIVVEKPANVRIQILRERWDSAANHIRCGA